MEEGAIPFQFPNNERKGWKVVTMWCGYFNRMHLHMDTHRGPLMCQCHCDIAECQRPYAKKDYYDPIISESLFI